MLFLTNEIKNIALYFLNLYDWINVDGIYTIDGAETKNNYQ
jgi:hypothetical protein